MITMYAISEQGLERMPEVVKNCWINVRDPSPEEVSQLQEMGLAPEFITYPLDVDERPICSKTSSRRTSRPSR